MQGEIFLAFYFLSVKSHDFNILDNIVFVAFYNFDGKYLTIMGKIKRWV